MNPFLIGGLIGFAVLTGAVGVQTLRLGSCQKDNAALQQQIASLSAQIEAQNAAVEALKAEGDRRVKAARQGVATARKGAQGATDEAARLRALLKAQGDCKAGVAAVREGLK